MEGERELGRLLRHLAPRLEDLPYEFVVVPSDQIGRLELPHVFAVIREEEGATVIRPVNSVKSDGAQQANYFARILLGVHSSLHGVGLSAAVSSVLAGQKISCNIVAGYHHDHLFVPWLEAERALKVLQKLVIDWC